MAEGRERTSEAWRGMRRGAGWGAGFACVLAGASVLTRGARPALKGAMKGVLWMREAGAEAGERVRDIYAEAETEYRAEAVSREEA